LRFDDQQVAGAAPGQVFGTGAPGVQRVGGDDRVFDLDTVQQRGEHRDLVGLRPTSTWPSTTPWP